MEQALRTLYTGRMLYRPREVPGGQATVRALIKRGLVERQGSFLIVTDAGREVVSR